MSLTVAQLDALARSEAADRLRSCCGSSRWVETMLLRRPFGTVEALLEVADEVWRGLSPADWDEAFTHHPRIGERQAVVPVGASARAWSAGEQSAANRAGAGTRAALAEANAAYERRFGRIYIVCAAGRGAEEILADIETRLRNDPERERTVVVEEQGKITRLRLRKLVDAENA